MRRAQVRAVPVRKDDEVNVVRGTYKARPHCSSARQAAARQRGAQAGG